MDSTAAEKAAAAQAQAQAASAWQAAAALSLLSPFSADSSSSSLSTLATVSLRPVSSTLGSASTLASTRYSPYPPSASSTLSAATAGAAARTPSGGRSLKSVDFFPVKSAAGLAAAAAAAASLRGPHGRQHSATGSGSISSGKPGSSGAIEAETARAALTGHEQLVFQASQSLPVRSLSRPQPADQPGASNAVRPLFGAAALEHYPLEALALLYTLAVQSIWSSTSLRHLRMALSTDARSTASAPEDSPSNKLLRFYQWTHQLLSRTRLPAFAVLSAIMYLHRLCRSPSHAGSAGMPVDPGSDYRVASTAAILANKYLDDNRFTNKTWGTVTGFTVAELTRMEVEFANSIAWNLVISDLEYSSFIEHELCGSGLWTLVVDVLGSRHVYLDPSLGTATRCLTVLSRKLPHDVDPAANKKAATPPAPAPAPVAPAPVQQQQQHVPLPMEQNPPLPTKQTLDQSRLAQLLEVMGNRRLPAAHRSLGDPSHDALKALATVQAKHRQASLLQAVQVPTNPPLPESPAVAPSIPTTRSTSSLSAISDDDDAVEFDQGEEGENMQDLVIQIQRGARLQTQSPEPQNAMSIDFLVSGNKEENKEDERHGLIPITRDSSRGLSDRRVVVTA